MKSIITLVLALAVPFVAVADDDAQADACMEGPLAQFGRYVGDWKITDESLAQDGSGWQPGNGARWVFKCIGDGVAIQDFWHPNGGGYGTNLRTYNPDTGKWEIVWAAGRQNGLMHISAELQEDGSVLMDVLKPEQPQPRRITFMPPDENGWDWAMEWSFDGGETWTAVYRIRATPWED
ncbi:MAG: hypothetical protein R3358_03975 [Woeseiaceae bacterium]|nr:hypothetical protein [Woeseiaceae bacterium]